MAMDDGFGFVLLIYLFLDCASAAIAAPANSLQLGGGGGGGVGGGKGAAQGQDGGGCPRVCFCNTPSRMVYCSRRGLTSIPDDIPDDSLQINLNGNVFDSSVIRRVNLSRYADLEHLYLSECALEAIEVGAFLDLGELKWLDLSNNRLKVLREHTFSGLKLQHLFLNGNRNLGLYSESFHGLLVTGLYLHDCSLNSVQPDIFLPLNSTLKNLWLNGNELQRLSRRFQDLFTTLIHLRLGFNPLNCNCEAVWLKEFYELHPDMFKGAHPPSCLTPARLKGKFFNDLTLSDFKCQTPMFTNVEAHFGRFQGKLKCGAVGEPVPSLYWIQPSGKATKFDPPSTSGSSTGGVARDGEGDSKIEGVLNFSWGEEITPPFGMYICIANNEAGNVTLTINIPSVPLRQAMYPINFDNPVDSTVQPIVINNSPKLNSSQHHSSSSPIGRQSPLYVDASSPSNHVQSRLLSDSLSLRISSTSAAAMQQDWQWKQNNNYTVVDAVPIYITDTVDRRYNDERLFTVGELTWAVVSTHLLTLLLCLLVITVMYRTRCKPKQRNSLLPCWRERRLLVMRRDHDRQQQQQLQQLYSAGSYSDNTQKSVMSSVRDDDVTECVYLNGLRHHRLQSYTDSPPLSIRR